MVELTIQALIRIIATALPIAFVFLVVGQTNQETAKSILFLFAFINLISIASKAGLEPYINQVFSIRFNNKYFYYPLMRILLIVSVACTSFTLLGKLFYVDGAEGYQAINYSIIISTLVFTINAVLVHYLQARKSAKAAILIGLIYPYLALSSYIINSPESSINVFLSWFSLIYFSSCLAMSIMLAYQVYTQKKATDLGEGKEPPTFKYSPELWLSNFSGQGKLWFVQVLLASLLDTGAYLSFMELLRIAQIPLAALVGANFISHNMLSHRDTFNKTKLIYYKICKISGALAMLSILAIPCYFAFFNDAQLLSYEQVLIAWVLGFFIAPIGPIGVLFDTMKLSRLIIIFRFLGFVITYALILLNHSYFYPTSILTILLIVFVSEFTEKILMLKKFHTYCIK